MPTYRYYVGFTTTGAVELGAPIEVGGRDFKLSQPIRTIADVMAVQEVLRTDAPRLRTAVVTSFSRYED